MPVTDHSLKIAVAHAGGFLEASTARCLASLLQRDLGRQRRLITLSGDASTCSPLALLFRSIVLMDKANRVLAKGLPPAVPTSYRALADHGEVPRSTLHARAQGRRSIEEKAQSQRYLSPWEEDAVVKFLLQMYDLERAEMEAVEATKAKGKRGRKRTRTSSEADATEPKRKAARARERLAPPQASVPSPRVPVSRMY